jgi:hypothetical protein
MQCGMSGPASGSGQVTATSAVAAARGTTLAWWTGEPPTPRIWRTGGSTKIKFALDAGDGRARKGWKIYTRKSPSRCSPGLSCRTHSRCTESDLMTPTKYPFLPTFSLIITHPLRNNPIFSHRTRSECACNKHIQGDITSCSDLRKQVDDRMRSTLSHGKNQINPRRKTPPGRFMHSDPTLFNYMFVSLRIRPNWGFRG